jgi:hypothetical protein
VFRDSLLKNYLILSLPYRKPRCQKYLEFHCCAILMLSKNISDTVAELIFGFHFLV